MSLINLESDLFQTIYEYYTDTICELPSFSYDRIYYTNNIQEDVELFCPPEEERLNGSAYGLTILPNSILEEPVILIEIQPSDLRQNIESLLHELIHITDYYIFASEYTEDNVNAIIHHGFFHIFREYSEFKAKAFGEMLSLKFMDLLIHTNSYALFEHEHENLITSFIQNKKQNVLNRTFTRMDLSVVLGAIYTQDSINNVHDIKDSCCENYLSILFSTNMKEFSLNLYKFYLDSMLTTNIFEVLPEINNLYSQYFD